MDVKNYTSPIHVFSFIVRNARNVRNLNQRMNDLLIVDK